MVYGHTVDKLDLPTATKRGKWRELHCRTKRQTFLFDFNLHKNIACFLKQSHANKVHQRKPSSDRSPQYNSLVNGTLKQPMDKEVTTNLSFFSSNPLKQNNTSLPVQSFLYILGQEKHILPDRAWDSLVPAFNLIIQTERTLKRLMCQ